MSGGREKWRVEPPGVHVRAVVWAAVGILFLTALGLGAAWFAFAVGDTQPYVGLQRESVAWPRGLRQDWSEAPDYPAAAERVIRRADPFAPTVGAAAGEDAPPRPEPEGLQ